MFKYGKTSNRKLNTCHIDLQKIFRLAISRSDVDFGISEGHRPVTIQQGYYAIGRTVEIHREPITNVDGVIRVGEHNVEPSNAVDYYAYHPNFEIRKKIAYDKKHLSYIYGIISSCAKELLEKGEITHKIRSGSNWDGDGIIEFDQKLIDYPHVELLKI